MESQRQREQVNSFTTAIARATDEDEIARTLLEHVVGLLRLDFGGLAVVEDGEARGLLARLRGEELPWWPETRMPLSDEQSALARSIVQAAPVVIDDVEGSPHVNRRLADALGAKSAAFVPAITSHGVVAALAVAATQDNRPFSSADMALLEELATETAIALERARSAAALEDALGRERLVASIARRVRSELDLDVVLRVAVEEVGRAIGCTRCFVRLGGEEGAGQILAEWDSAGFAPIGDRAAGLPVLDLAVRERRTIAAGDILDLDERERDQIGSVDVLLELETRAVLTAPLLVFDSIIGALVVHRAEPTAWSDAEITLVESVASEVGVAVHIARLLRENERRIAQDAALLKAARVVSASSTRPSSCNASSTRSARSWAGTAPTAT